MNQKDLHFTKEHEWLKIDGEIAIIGISNYAQTELGDIVYVELPAVGDNFNKNDECASIESVKSVSPIYCPLTGEVAEINEILVDHDDQDGKPETINKDPYGQGWIVKLKIKDQKELDGLMTDEEYQQYLEGISQE